MSVAARLQSSLAELAPGATRLLAAVSGGADSLALLHALVEAGRRPVVAHLDHALREDSAADAAFVASECESLGVEYIGGRSEVARIAAAKGWNVEDAARRLRYDFLARAAGRTGADAILTGHTLDDQAETVLMQILRGAAYPTGMRARRGRIVRPLLGVRHHELEEYLRARGRGWREDESNRDRRLLRAWLRHEILPALERRFPRVQDALARHAEVQAAVAAFLRSRADRLGDERGGLDAARLRRAPLAVQREAIASLLEEAGVAREYGRIEEVRKRLGDDTSYRLSVAPGAFLRLHYGRLEVARVGERPEEKRVSGPLDLPPGVHPRVLELPDLVLRGRRPGDLMRLGGGSRTLKRLLIDRKVPREERAALRVLASGNRVLWVEGIGPASDAQIQGPPGAGHEEFMRRALRLAGTAGESGELPVGAVVVRDGEVIGEGHNETERLRDPSAHAELLAMRRAAQAIGDWRLDSCTLYVTLEPCPMCAGAMLQSHLGRVVYGAANRRDGALGSVADVLAEPWKWKVAVVPGVLAQEAGGLLTGFFRDRRDGRE